MPPLRRTRLQTRMCALGGSTASGIGTGASANAGAPATEEKRTREEIEMDEAMEEIDAANEKERAHEARLEREVAVENWRALMGTFEGSAVNHVCTNTTCSFDAIIAGELYGCRRTGALHECGSDGCREHMHITPEFDFVCGLTGRVVGKVYSDAWAKSIGTAPVAVESREVAGLHYGVRDRYSHKPSRTSALQRHGGATGVVRQTLAALLLRGVEDPAKDPRTRIVPRAQLEQLLDDKITKGVRAFSNGCLEKGVVPLMRDVRRVAYAIQREELRTRFGECDPDRFEHYVQRICMWWAMLSSEMPPSQHAEAHIEKFTIGIVYRMQHGIIVQDTELEPPDPWLFDNLPRVSELKNLGFRSKTVTNGSNVIQKALMKRVLAQKSIKPHAQW